MNTLEPVRASIDPSFLSKVDRVFDASPRTVFNELVQNARRAGATHVQVELVPAAIPDDIPEADRHEHRAVHVLFSDNGCGMEKPNILLRLAGNEWDKATMATEDPAGMGFFCLSNFPVVRVSSCLWTALLDPRIFRGEAYMEPERVNEGIAGTQISWTWPEMDAHSLRSNLEAAVLHSGLEKVTLKGPHTTGNTLFTTELRVEPFTQGCPLVIDYGDRGYTLGIDPHAHSWPYAHNHLSMNFKGVQLVEQMDHKVGSLADLDRIARHVRVDVTRTVDLHLVLPARNALKHNSARSQLMLDAEDILLRYTAQALKDKHDLSFSTYQRAQELGIDIGHAEKKLRTLGGEGFRSDNTYMDKALVAASHTFKENVFLFGWGQTPNTPAVVSDKDRYKGYPWYDAMPTIAEAHYVINGIRVPIEALASYDFLGTDMAEFWAEDAPFSYDQIKEALAPNEKSAFRIVSKITFWAKDSNGVEYTKDLPAVVATSSKCSYFGNLCDESVIYISQDVVDNTELAGDVVDIIEELGFEASDDPEADNWETQQEEFQQDAMAAVLEVIGGDMEARRYQLEVYCGDSPYEARDANLVWTIHFPGGKGASAKLVELRELGSHPEKAWGLLKGAGYTPERLEAILDAAATHGLNDEMSSEARAATIAFIREQVALPVGKPAHRRIVCADPNNNSNWIEELVSAEEITPERVERYLAVEHSFDEDDGFVLDSTETPVDLDAWEAENPEDDEEADEE